MLDLGTGDPEPLGHVPDGPSPAPSDDSLGGVDEPARDPVLGLCFGDYQLEEEIAHGGMGVVYRARQLSLDRTVAVKLLLLGRYSSADSIERFRREAQAVAALRHPNIVALHEVGECEGQHYFSMEYVDGASLAERLRAGPLPSSRCAEIARAMAGAMHYAHGCGVMHRDLKPSNVLLDAFGQVRITDFGLAKRLDGTSDLTVPGQIVGTPNYLAPEQAAGRSDEIGPLSDVYAIGAVLYELLTGRPPFLAHSLQETLLRIRDTDPIPPHSLNPAVARDLETISLKCLQKQPAQRYPSAQALADDLTRFLSQQPILARPVAPAERVLKWIRRNPRLATLCSITVLAVTGLFVSQTVMSFRLARANRVTRETNARLTDTVRDLEWQKAEDFIAAGKTASGLANLNRFLRDNPRDQVVASRILSLLNLHSFALPVSEPLRHAGTVINAGFGSEGRLAYTASVDGTASLWELATSRQVLSVSNQSPIVAAALLARDSRLVTLDGQAATVWDVASGRRLASFPRAPKAERVLAVNADRTRFAFPDGPQILVIDIRSGRPVGPPLPNPGVLYRAQFSPDSRHLATGTVSASLAVWDLETGRPAFESRPLYRPSVEFSPDGTRLAAASGDGSLWIIEARTGQVIQRRQHLAGDPFLVQFTPDGRRLVTAFWSSFVQVWDVGTLEPIGAPLGLQDWTTAVAISPDSRQLVTGTRQGSVRVWDLETGQAILEPFEHEGPITAVAIDADGSQVITASDDGTARVWNLQMRHPPPGRTWAPGRRIREVAFSPDGERLLIATDRVAQLRDARTGEPLGSPIADPSLFDAGFSADGRLLFTASGKTGARLWDGRTGAPLGEPLAHDRDVWQCAFSPDGRVLLTTSRDERARVWNTATGVLVHPPLVHPDEVICVGAAPDNQRFATGCLDGAVRIWSLEAGRELVPPLRHKGLVWSLAFSPDGQRLVTGSGDKSAVVWDSATGRPVGAPLAHENAVFHVAFSPDNLHVLTASEDGTARVWDARTGRPRSVWMRHRGPVWSARFSPDGRLVATASNDGAARLWDAATGYPVTHRLAHPSEVHRVNFSPDGRQLITGSKDGTVRLWDVFLAPVPVPDWFLDLADALAGKRLGLRGEIMPVSQLQLHALRERLIASPSTDFYSRWGRWLLQDRLFEPPPAFVP